MGEENLSGSDKVRTLVEILGKTALVAILLVLSVVGVRTSIDNHQSLVILERVTGQAAQVAQAKSLRHITYCLENYVAFSDGHAPLDPSCRDVDR